MKTYTVSANELQKYRNGKKSKIDDILEEIIKNAPHRFKPRFRYSKLFLDYYLKPTEIKAFKIPYCFFAPKLGENHINYLQKNIIIVEWKFFSL